MWKFGFSMKKCIRKVTTQSTFMERMVFADQCERT